MKRLSLHTLQVLVGAESKFDVKGRLSTGTDNSGEQFLLISQPEVDYFINDY